MKKKLITSMIAGCLLAAALSGCRSAAATDSTTLPAAEESQKSSEDTETTKEQAEEQSSYDPSAFQTADVHIAPEQTSTIDISGCDTFTQIVDKLDAGMGYANEKIGDTDVLMVSSGTYEWEEGKFAAIDAEIFYYNDGIPTYLATVSAGGTAYPLAIKDGNLYVGGNHFMSKYLIDNGYLIETEEAYVQYDESGKGIYYYRTCNSQFEDYDEPTAENRFNELFTEQEGADMIIFQPVGGGN